MNQSSLQTYLLTFCVCMTRLKLQMHGRKPANTLKMLCVGFFMSFKDNPQKTM